MLYKIFIFLILVLQHYDFEIIDVTPSSQIFSIDVVYMFIEDPSDIKYTYKLYKAKFGIEFISQNERSNIKLAIPFDACLPLIKDKDYHNTVILASRGSCSFVTKAINAQNSHAKAIIIYDLSKDNVVSMVDDLTNRTVSIPALFMIYQDGKSIVDAMTRHHLDHVNILIPVNVTGVPLHKQNLTPWSLW